MQSIVAQEDERESQTASTSVSILATDHFLDRLAEIQQSIAGRAYQLFEERGQLDGHDLEDWLNVRRCIVINCSFFSTSNS